MSRTTRNFAPRKNIKQKKMKLAEALSIRADLQKRIAQLKERLKNSSKIQEGDEPAENPKELFEKLDSNLIELEDLIYRINVTNMNTMHEGVSLTKMIAQKDALTLRVSTLRDVLNNVVERDGRHRMQEIKYIRTIDVAELRREVDNYSRQLRILDLKIQSLNWVVELE
jgi:uncharacterized coiled-coil DUF342 family protein